VTAVLQRGEAAFCVMHFICFFSYCMRKQRSIKGVIYKQGAKRLIEGAPDNRTPALRDDLQNNLPLRQNNSHHEDGYWNFAVLLTDCRNGDEMKEIK